MINLKIYTDGSCYYKTRKGGMGVYIMEGEKEHFISKGYSNTTISRMEGIALLTAIRSLSKTERINAEFYIDSEYIVKSFTEQRLQRWQMLNWMGIANQDMWQSILLEIQERPLLQLVFHHIRGHQTHIENPHILGNCIADLLSCYKNFTIYEEDKQL